jgi:hypothetical protein
VVDQWEAAEQECEERETHDESKDVGDREHLHAVLRHHVSVVRRGTGVVLRIVNVVVIEILAHEPN